MKITGVTTYHLPGTRYPWVFLHIDTDSGLHGIGQVSSGPNSDGSMHVSDRPGLATNCARSI
jgi:L-alanine-DL-glutamate epimerase-like enolase superfamily enzyme